MEEGVAKNQGEGIGEAVRVARGAVVSVPDNGVPSLLLRMRRLGVTQRVSRANERSVVR